MAFIKQPLYCEGRDWLKFGLMGAGTFMAMQADQPVRTPVLKDQRYYNSALIEGGRILGESYTAPIVAVALGYHGWLTGNTSTNNFGFELGQAIIYSAAITRVLSKSVGRTRLNQNMGRASYQPFASFGKDDYLFPGGHATVAFMISAVYSKNYSSDFLKVFVCMPSVVTVVSRVYKAYHRTSDVLLGTAIGCFAAEWVVNQHDQKENRIELSSVYPLTLRIILN